MQLPGPNASLTGTFTDYGQWVPINNGTVDIAQARIGVNAGVPSTLLQIQFLQDTSFWEGSTIEVSGVRVDLTGVSPGGEEVFVSFATAEGSAAISPEQLKVARSTDPLECDDCEPTISFNSDGTPINDVATLTIRELFHNAFEAPSRIQLYVSNVPAGYHFDGIAGVSASGNVIASQYGSCSGSTCYISITDQNPGYIEEIYVGLQFSLIGVPDFTSGPANVRITLYPPGGYFGGDVMPWNIYGVSGDPSGYGLRYSALYINCSVSFTTMSELNGRLLSVFNVSDDVWDTGIAIMNGSGVPQELIARYGPDFVRASLPQTGAVKVLMYPMYTPAPDAFDPYGFGASAAPGNPYIFTTSATARPGLGLDANGRVPFNGTWAVLVSQLCSEAMLDTNGDGVGNGETCAASGSTFEGFIIFQTEFFNAEGVNFIADWSPNGDSTMSHGYPMINLRWNAAEIVERDKIDDIWWEIAD